jgi:peptide/nickel transport system substrate-binding protein
MDRPLIARRAFLSLAFHAGFSRALARHPYGGALRLELPLSMDGVDPHAGDDPFGALFANAVADPLFGLDASGRPYPALAAALPEPVEKGARLLLRPGLVTARGQKLSARDVVSSLERSRAGRGRAVLAQFKAVRAVRGDPLAVDVEGAAPEALAIALACPVTAIVPRSFNPGEPDGTGAFRVTRMKDGMTFERNERAARGPAFLDRIEVRRAGDLASELRAFEVGDSDIGFLGAGLHRRRALAVDFRTESFGWLVLRTGPLAGPWGAPGVAARLVAGVDPSRFSHLGIAPRGGGTAALWGGAPADLLVDEGSSYLVEIARAVSGVLSDAGHEIRPTPLPHAELRRRRDEGRFSLAIDFVRRLGPTSDQGLLSILSGADPKLADKPPHFSALDYDALTRTLPLAVLGELSFAGARAPDLHGVEQWDLGGVFRGV